MQSLNQTNSFSFKLVATLLIITAGLALGVSWPTIRSWQFTQIDKILSEANNTNNKSDAIQLNKLAATIGINDPLATERLANQYWLVGEYSKALSTYQNSWLELNYVFLGNSALKASNPDLAKSYFSDADKESETAESQAGLATVAFIENRTDQGCNHADRAKKLNLSSSAATTAGDVCTILTNTSTLPERAKATKLINAYLFDIGLDRFKSIQDKSSTDLQLIAQVYAGRGEYDKAINEVKAGLEQEPSNQTLLEMIIELNSLSGKSSEDTIYQTQLDDLKFTNFSN